MRAYSVTSLGFFSPPSSKTWNDLHTYELRFELGGQMYQPPSFGQLQTPQSISLRVQEDGKVQGHDGALGGNLRGSTFLTIASMIYDLVLQPSTVTTIPLLFTCPLGQVLGSDQALRVGSW